MTWRQVFDGKFWQAEIAQIYDVNSIPCTYLIGRDGKIRQRQKPAAAGGVVWMPPGDPPHHVGVQQADAHADLLGI